MNKISKSLSLVLISTVFIGCNWQLPEKITIKQKAEYNIPISNVDIGMSEFVDLSSVIDSINSGSDPDTKGYFYNPADTSESLQFLVQKKLQSTSINVSEYFNEEKLRDSLKNMSFNKTFDVPEVSFDFSKNVSINELTERINNLVVFNSYGTNSVLSPVAGDGLFDSVQYANGYMEAEFLNRKLPDGTSVFLKYNGTTVASGSCKDGGVIIQLANTTIHTSNMSISYMKNRNGEEIPSDISVLWKVNPASQIICATGITLNTPVETQVSTDVSFDETSAEFEECTVGQGYLDVTLNFSDKWENVDISYDLKFTGALNDYDAVTSGPNKHIDLHDKLIKKGTTDIVSNITFRLNDTTIYLTDDYAPEVKTESVVSQIKEAVFILEDVETSSSESMEIPSDVRDYVTAIGLLPSGIDIVYDTDFPAENDINLKVRAPFFCIDQTKTIETGRGKGNFDFKSDFKGASSYRQTLSDFEEIIFNVDMILPGASASNPNKITLHNITPESSYYMNLDITPIIEWDYVVINSEKIDTEDSVLTGVNFNDYLSQLDEVLGSPEGDSILSKIAFKRVPLFMYISLPEIFNNFEIKADIKGFYGEQDISGNIEKLPGMDAVVLCDKNDKILSVSVPELQTKEDGNTVVSDLDELESSYKTEKIADLLNNVLTKENGQLIVDYSISMKDPNASSNEIIVYNDENLNKDAEIQLAVAIVLPLEFDIIKNIDLDIVKLMGKDNGSDILGRETFDEIEGFTADLLDMVTSVSLDYDLKQFPFEIKPNKAMTIKANLYGDGNKANNMALKMGKDQITLDSVFIKHVLGNPFTPTINVSIGTTSEGTSLIIPSDLKVLLDANINIKTNGAIEIESPLKGAM